MWTPALGRFWKKYEKMNEKIITYISKKNKLFSFLFSIGMLRTSDLAEIGIYLLENNIIDDNICILAGLESGELEEVIDYYELVISKLGLNFSKEIIANEEIQKYGLICIDEYLKGNYSKSSLMSIVRAINSTTLYSTDFVAFDSIEDDKSLIDEEGHPYFNPEMTKDNYDFFLDDFIQTFYKLETIANYKALNGFCYCQKCKLITNLKIKKNIFKNYNYFVCSNCKNKKIIHCQTLTGMKYYISENT